MRKTVIFVVLLSLGSPLGAQEVPWEQSEKSTLIAQRLFPPDLILECQREIDLQPIQRTQILDAYRELQSGRAADLQILLLERSVGLDSLLIQPLVDQTEALTQVDEILEAERLVKRLHLAALIEIKNILNPEQQQFLTNVQKSEWVFVGDPAEFKFEAYYIHPDSSLRGSGEIKPRAYYIHPASSRRPACGGSG